MSLLGRIRRWYSVMLSQTETSRYERVLAWIPEEAFLLPGQTNTRRDLEAMIRRGEHEALTSALAYAASLAEDEGLAARDEFWVVLGGLAQEMGQCDGVEPYWPDRLPLPWRPVLQARRGPVVLDEELYRVMRDNGAGPPEVANAAVRAGVSKVDGVRLLRGLFQVSLSDATALMEQAEGAAGSGSDT